MDDDATTTTLFTDEDDCSNWSELHEDMIHQIFKKMTSAADFFRFGCVCVSWGSIPLAAYLHPDLLHPQLPLLMIPTPDTPPLLTNSTSTTTTTKEETRSFYVLSERSVHKDIKISLPYNRNCRGSSHGWIITTAQEDTGYSVELFNPLISVINNNNTEYQKKIQLPSLTVFEKDCPRKTYSREYLYKAIVSVNPSSHPRDFVVMIIYGRYRMRRLGFWRPGDQDWTLVHLGQGRVVHDVIYHKGLFYAVDGLGEVMVVDLNVYGAIDQPPSPSVRRLVVAPPTHEQLPPSTFKKYLVESAGDLLLVDKGMGLEDWNDTVFRVFQLIITENGTYKWEVLNTLPGRMLFLGDNASISLAASDFPGGKSSCIYFTDEEKPYLHHGIFNMEEDKTIEKFRPMGEYISPINNIWVLPTLRCCFRF